MFNFLASINELQLDYDTRLSPVFLTRRLLLKQNNGRKPILIDVPESGRPVRSQVPHTGKAWGHLQPMSVFYCDDFA